MNTAYSRHFECPNCTTGVEVRYPPPIEPSCPACGERTVSKDDAPARRSIVSAQVAERLLRRTPRDSAASAKVPGSHSRVKQIPGRIRTQHSNQNRGRLPAGPRVRPRPAGPDNLPTASTGPERAFILSFIPAGLNRVVNWPLRTLSAPALGLIADSKFPSFRLGNSPPGSAFQLGHCI